MSKDRKLIMVVLAGLLVFGFVGCGAPEEKETAEASVTEQLGQRLETLSAEEMKKLLPDSWPGAWTLFATGHTSEVKPEDIDMMVDEGSVALYLGKGKGKIGPAQRVIIYITDLQDLSAEKGFKTENLRQKAATGELVILEAITFKGHKVQVSKVPDMMGYFTLKYCSGRFEVEVQAWEDQGTTLDDLKTLCSALKL